MANSVYIINKGVNRSIEFKGLKAQYIMYVGIGVLSLIILFFILYTIGISQYICMTLILVLGGFMIFKIYGMSRKYGEHGLMKMMAKKNVPKHVRCNSRRCFIKPGKQTGKL